MATLVSSMDKSRVGTAVDEYMDYHDDSKDNKLAKRKTDYTTMVNHYYDLATDLYEYGWGQSFHFSQQTFRESFQAATQRHEHYLALKMKLGKGQKVLDCGCGVGGPARNIANFSGCSVVGLNNNDYQLERARAWTSKEGLEQQVSFKKGNFMEIPFEDNTFDAVYEIEAAAHAPVKKDMYAEVLRVLKPGGVFAGYEWCLTDKFQEENPLHQQLKKGIEEGNGLPDISSTAQVMEALKEAGFEGLESEDLACNYRPDYEYPWYFYITPGVWPPSRVQFTKPGRFVCQKSLELAEKAGLAPKGTCGVTNFLNTAAYSLAEGGRLGIFTPMFFHLAVKPKNE